MENNDKQQIGGYFSTKNASKDEALKGIVAARISASEDVTDKEYTALSNLIRVATSDGCRISIGTGNEKQIKQNITNRNASPGRNGGIFFSHTRKQGECYGNSKHIIYRVSHGHEL